MRTNRSLVTGDVDVFTKKDVARRRNSMYGRNPTAEARSPQLERCWSASRKWRLHLRRLALFNRPGPDQHRSHEESDSCRTVAARRCTRCLGSDFRGTGKSRRPLSRARFNQWGAGDFLGRHGRNLGELELRPCEAREPFRRRTGAVRNSRGSHAGTDRPRCCCNGRVV
jgi:hypothetical protein